MPKPLPVIDIRLFYSNRSLFVERLRDACHNVGFFLLKHNLPGDLVKEQLDQSQQFFDLSLNEKMKVSYEHHPSFRGYMKLGVENTSGKMDCREQVEYAVEYEKPYKSWPPYERLKAQNPWPNASLKKVCHEYAKQVCRIADCLRIGLCLALNLDPEVLSPHFCKPKEPPHWVLKLISYPPVDHHDSIDSTQGVGPHTDTNFLTLVLQDEVGGLQAFSEGEWIHVPTSLGTDVLVCNLGEQAQVFSRGYFLATPHRVVANKSGQRRLSVPLFYNPALSARIEPLSELSASLPFERPTDYEHTHHWHRTNNQMLTCVGDNTFKSLARSHPHVFAQHHGDLVLSPDGRVAKKDG